MSNKTAIVIGAGIVGLATARALAVKGYKVTVIERNTKAVGASIRNFGMVWPVGQPTGKLYERAMRSRAIWKAIADASDIWYDECGSMHLAYHEDEWTVLNELQDAFKNAGRSSTLVTPEAIQSKYQYINNNNLIGGLYSPAEMIVNPRKAIPAVALFLAEKYRVEFVWEVAISSIQGNKVFYGDKYSVADIIFVCSGADFETLYPDYFKQLPITKCKLQMMKYSLQNNSDRIGTAVCGGLSLIHYNSFKEAKSLYLLKQRFENELQEYVSNGIHVMVSQNDDGDLIVGDTHEYGHTFDPFDKHHLNKLIEAYLSEICVINSWQQTETWHGIYPKMTDGSTEIFLKVAENIFILNGIGGAGMTLSFGLAEEIIDNM
ncbi:MAG: TIGR03364 family FAD-dependent oxidoreductase [Chitinophaga sp.]|jgi:FAD dependent oxidoreductase TIGR03364|nr:TIGR03364 family FAD-dependent oxidoreductase [Chitinophaga sp.]